MKRILGGMVVAAALSGSAFAADLGARTYTKAPAMIERVYNWSGFYAGVNAGGVISRDSNSLSVANAANPFFVPAALAGIGASGSQSLNSTGFIGGGQIGYNWQAPGSQFVWGIEADFQGMTGKKTAGGTFHYTTDLAPYSLTESASTDWLFTLRPRLGWATGSTLWYVTGGLAVTDRKFSQEFTDFAAQPGPILAGSANQTSVGWTVGAGLETSVAANWTVKAEYLFAQFDAKTSVFNLSNSGNAATFTNTDKLDMHIFRLGLNYRFDAPALARY